MSERVLKVITGSRMWGTATPESDIDYKEVIMSPLSDVLSPFKIERIGKGVQKIDADDDTAVYELMHLFRLIEKGNPTILELLYTPLVQESNEVGKELRKHRSKWLNSNKIVSATLGMGKAQISRAERYTKDDPQDSRIGKLLASTILSLELSINVLGSRGLMGDIEPTPYRDFLLSLKAGETSSYPDALEVINEKSLALQGLDRLVSMETDKTFAESFCYYWYLRREGFCK